MTTIRTNLTSDQIRDEAIRHEINSYLREGEEMTMLVMQHGGLIKTVQKLREREFAKLDQIAVPIVKKTAANPITPVKSKPKKKPSDTDKKQSDLF